MQQPKNPHLKPNPRAALDSFSKVKELSFNFSFPNEFFNESYSFASKGYNPQKTTGILGLNPGSGSSLLGFLLSMVSPTQA